MLGDERLNWSELFPPPDYASLPLVAPLLSKLGVGEAVDIRIKTTGCFGGSTYDLRFQGPPPLRVIVKGRLEATDDADLPMIGETLVTEADAVRIDHVLAVYRSGQPNDCITPVSDVRARWKLVIGDKNERWNDSPCNVGETALSLDLWTLAQQVSPPVRSGE